MKDYSKSHARPVSIMNKLLTLLFVLSCTITVFAQNRSVQGTVTDSTGELLIGVNVSVKGTTIGTITNIDGHYGLEVPANSTLVFSYVGYVTQEIAVGSQNILDVTLADDSQALDEVVVVGYGVQKKVTVTGSVATVSGEELKASPTTNLTNAMVGRMPGVIGFQRSDEPGGGGTTIRIRGSNSLGNKDPLIVIDGTCRRSGPYQPERNRIHVRIERRCRRYLRFARSQRGNPDYYQAGKRGQTDHYLQRKYGVLATHPPAGSS